MEEPLISFIKEPGLISDRQEAVYEDVIALMNSPNWYSTCSKWYSSLVEPSIDGMLGGLSYVHDDDVKWSVMRLKQLAASGAIKTDNCLDCGGGIGRVSHFVLKPVFQNVDMIEGCKLFVNTSMTNFAKDSIRTRYNLSLQDTEELARQLAGEKYDVVFLQWVIGHLTDRDVLSFLQFVRDHLLVAQTGCIIMKENCILQGGFFLDKEDVNLIRSLDMIKALCSQAKLRITNIDSQQTWPSQLYPVRFIVLSPI